jgi:hypothetical protein
LLTACHHVPSTQEERPFAYFDSIESNEALGAHVRHILVQNGSAQISSYILSYLHLLPNLKRLSTLCWHLDLPLPEDVLNFPLRKPTPHCITIDVGRFASASYNIIVGKWFDFAQLRKRASPCIQVRSSILFIDDVGLPAFCLQFTSATPTTSTLSSTRFCPCSSARRT